MTTLHHRSKKWDGFLPKGESKFVFAVVMACYSWTLSSLVQTVAYAVNFYPSPAGALTGLGTRNISIHIIELLILSPIAESLVLVAIIELVRKLGGPAWLQFLFPALVLATLHGISWPRRSIIVAPGFFMETVSYLYWRSASWRWAFAVIAGVHFFHNIVPAISVLGRFLRG